MKIKQSHIISCLVIVLALCNFFIFLFTPLSGDDYAYKSNFFGPCLYSDSLLDYPRWVVRHWVYNNGRIFNLILPLLLGINKVVISSLGAFFIFLFYKQAFKACRLCDSLLYSVILIAVFSLILPWWDSMTVFACQVNYIWVGAVIIWAYNRLTTDRKQCDILTLILMFVAAAAHEAASLPLLVGFVAYYSMRRTLPPTNLRPLFIAFALGTAFVALCPGIILRANTSAVPDDPIIPLALKTIPAVIVMLLIVAWMSLTSTTRKVVSAAFKTETVVLFVAAIVSAVIALASGIVGRSGWFAEIYAVLFIFSIINKYRYENRALSYIIYILLLIQTVQVIQWQYKLGREAERVESLYKMSDNNVIYFDATADTDVPWWVLGRFKGVADADDVYLLSTLAKYYHPGSPIPVILPAEIKDMKIDGDTTLLASGSFITKDAPKDVQTYMPREKIGIMLYNRDGEQWVVQEFEKDGQTLFYHTRRILDPGDR